MMNQPHVNMAAVAAALGCHQSTVSRALRHDPRLSHATREKVQAACQEMGYRPNPLVSALINSRKRKGGSTFQAQIAYLTYNPYPGLVQSGTYMAKIFDAAQTRAEELGYLLQEFPKEELPGSARALHRVLKARGVCGVVFGSMPPRTPVIDFPWEHYPAVTIGFGMEGPEIYRVATNNHESTWQAMQICRQLGYRRIGFAIARDENLRTRGHEIGGYIAGQVDLQEEDRIPHLIAEPRQLDRIAEWLVSYRPDVVMTSYPETILRIAAEHGWRSPRDIGIVAMGNLHGPFFARMERALHRIGELAAELVIHRVERGATGIPKNAGQYLINPRWVEGPSVMDKASSGVSW